MSITTADWASISSSGNGRDGEKQAQSRPAAQQAKRSSSGLKDHQRHKKTLTPPFLTLPNLKQTSWQHDGLPDFIWLQAVREETGSLAAAHDALDVLDAYVSEPTKEQEEAERTAQGEGHYKPHPNTQLDGRISTFILVPDEQRASAREALRDNASWGLPDRLGHALALYPECPAAWLYEHWVAESHADPEIGTAFLKRLVAELLNPRDRPSSQIRLLPLARMAKHGRLHLLRDMEIVELLPKYPGGLSEEDQLHVEQWGRATFNIVGMTSDRTVTDAWCRYFWRQSWKISACEPEPDFAPPEDDTEISTEAIAQDRISPEPTVSQLQVALVEAINALGEDLRALQRRVEVDLYNPTPDEVKLGLASRMFRLLRQLAVDVDLWTNEMGPHVLRSMIDSRITVAWLLNHDDPALYAKFKEYGLGKRKLFKLQLEDLMSRDDLVPDEHNEALYRRLEAEVNQDAMEEFVRIEPWGHLLRQKHSADGSRGGSRRAVQPELPTAVNRVSRRMGQPGRAGSRALRQPPCTDITAKEGSTTRRRSMFISAGFEAL